MTCFTYLTTPILIEEAVIIFKIQCFRYYNDWKEIYTGNVIVDTDLTTNVNAIELVNMTDENVIKSFKDTISEAICNCKDRAGFIFAAKRRC